MTFEKFEQEVKALKLKEQELLKVVGGTGSPPSDKSGGGDA